MKIEADARECMQFAVMVTGLLAFYYLLGGLFHWRNLVIELLFILFWIASYCISRGLKAQIVTIDRTEVTIRGLSQKSVYLWERAFLYVFRTQQCEKCAERGIFIGGEEFRKYSPALLKILPWFFPWKCCYIRLDKLPHRYRITPTFFHFTMDDYSDLIKLVSQ